VCNQHTAHEAAGATGTRRFLRPLFSEGEGFLHNSGVSRREIARAYPFSSLKIESEVTPRRG
jgi:hypothetical protein